MDPAGFFKKHSKIRTMSEPRSNTSTGPILPKIQLELGLLMGWDNLKFHKQILIFCDRNLFFKKTIFDIFRKYFSENRKFPKIFLLENNFRSQKNNIFWWNFLNSNPMSRPSSSCIFGSSGPVEVSERGSYIFLIVLCFLKKVGHTLLSRIISDVYIF